MAPVNTRRSYRSTIRRGDAPQAILTAAATLFRTKGYLATSIDDIAAEAGVARPTVFAAVGPKPTMLKLVVDHATTGDDAPIPVAERAWSREALDAEDPATSLRLHARNSRRICERVADLLWAVESAAAVDPDAADVVGRPPGAAAYLHAHLRPDAWPERPSCGKTSARSLKPCGR